VLTAQARLFAESEAALERYVMPYHGGPEGAAPLLVKAKLRLAQGRYQEALKLASTGLATAERRGESFILPVGHLVMTTVNLRLNDLRSALHYQQRLSEGALFSRLPIIGAEAAWISAQVLRVHRGPQESAVPITWILENTLHDPEVLASQPAAAPTLTRFAMEQNPQTAAQIAFAAGCVATYNPDIEAIRASALHAAGLVRKSPELLIRAAERQTDPWTSALASEDAGLLLAQRPDARAAGIERLESALTAYDAIGSAHDFARVKARLRQLRDHRRRAPDRTKTPQRATGKSGLTAAETLVAELVSQGLTNNQVAKQIYLSQHTVAYHLKSIFGKLNVSSRGQLTSMWSLPDSKSVAGN
jgi:DNA-binding CsgD family transcriptional regulator/tetratricopeptide (TPR) repeat protein